MKAKPVQFFALNRNRLTVTEMTGFTCWEHLQGAFRCGIVMPDGHKANGIGRTANLARAAAKSGYKVI